VLTHEFLHLCVPTLDRRQAWFTEGLATYLEPLARAQRGLVRPEEVWAGFVKNMPEGLPKAGDRGLDHTPTWGRTYWGGALFCLVADLEIRKATAGRQSLADAVKALVKAGATKAVAMDLEPALRIADKGLEKPLLVALYRRWATEPVDVDLEALWTRLGVRREGGKVRIIIPSSLAYSIRTRSPKIPPQPTRSPVPASCAVAPCWSRTTRSTRKSPR